ncbi:MAG: hypothetical protein CMO26_11435 [Thiotrichales bacterium]|nr:hypothetical protein [Thiotrichales bacterium]
MKSITALILASLLIPNMAYALTLGGMEVKSKLNQRLQARIELRVDEAGELEDARAFLADQSTFDKAGIERPQILTSLEFEVVTNSDGSYIMVSSKEAIRNPQLNFIVEVASPDVRIQREYTVLLRAAAADLDRY